jgi:hypothetical protein
LVAVLEAHVDIAIKNSLDKRYALQQDVTRHLKRFSRFTYSAPFHSAYESAKDLKRKKVTCIEVPRTGDTGFMVYRRESANTFKLYAAYVKHGDRKLPFIRQCLDSSLPDVITLESDASFITLNGKFNFLNTVSALTPGPTTSKDLWQEYIEYDLVSHADFKPIETSEQRELKAVLGKNSVKYKKAKSYIRKNPKGSSVGKAKKFVKTYNKHKEKLESLTVTTEAWSKLNPALHLTFFVVDVFASDSLRGKLKLPMEYAERLEYFKELGFKVPKPVSIKLCKDTTIRELCSKNTLPRIKLRTNKDPLDLHDDWFE